MSSSGSDSEHSDAVQQPRGRKRQRNETAWKKNSVKLLHDAGQEYVSRKTGKLKELKELLHYVSASAKLF